MKKKVIYIKKLNKRKIAESVLGLFTIPLSLLIIVDVLNIKEVIDDSWIHNLGIDKENGLYYFINDYMDLGKYKAIFLDTLLALCVFVIIIQVILYLLKNRQEILLIIEHNSLNQMRYRYDDEIENNYNIKKLKFNQYENFNSNMPVEEMIILSITETDMKANKIRNYITKGYSIGYAGIANIPTTFLLGFELGDENSKKYFHKYHGKKTNPELKDDRFHLLKKKTIRSFFKLDILQESADLKREGNIVIIIALTQPIEEADYSSISNDNDYIYKYSSSDAVDYDVIDSETQIEQYADKILADIAMIQKKPNIKQIRICVAASGAFVFGLGTKFSKTQNIETIIYHFEKKQYPWGINVTKKIPVIN